MQDDVAKAIIARDGVPLTTSEHDAISAIVLSHGSWEISLRPTTVLAFLQIKSVLVSTSTYIYIYIYIYRRVHTRTCAK